MAKNSSKVKVTLSKDRFIAWISQFISIEKNKNIPLEISLDKSEIKCKLSNAEHVVIRYSTIPLSALFKPEDVTLLTDTFKNSDIRWGIYGADKLIKILKTFDSNEIEANLVISSADGQEFYSIDKITFSEDKLKYDVYSIPLSLLTFIEDAKYKIISDTTNSIAEFDLNLPNLIKIGSLSTLDEDQEEISFSVKKEKVFAQGKSFDYEIATAPSASDTKISVKKIYFSLVDKLAWKVYILDSNQIILSCQSPDNACELIIGGVDE